MLRCVLKDAVLTFMLYGSCDASRLYSDVQFVAVASLLINYAIRAPNWFKRSGVVLSFMIIEFQTQLATSLLLVLQEG